MGRLTPSFRQIYSEVLDDLRTEIRNVLVDPHNKEAFDLLYRQAWYPEEAAMGNSTLPTVLDKLCIVANIHTRKLIEILKDEISQSNDKIANIQNELKALDEKIAVNGEQLKNKCLEDMSSETIRKEKGSKNSSEE